MNTSNIEIYSINENNELCFSASFFQHCMSNALNDPSLQIISIHKISSPYETNIAKTKYTHETKKLIGLYKYNIIFQHRGNATEFSVLVKAKISNKEFMDVAANVLLKAGLNLDETDFKNYLQQTSLGNGDYREIKIYQLALQNNELAKFFPKIYGTYLDKTNDEYIILEELLTDAYLIEDYQDISFWNNANIVAAVKDLSKFHAIYYAKDYELSQMDWLGGITTTQKMLTLKPLWKAYVENLKSYEGSLFTTDDIAHYFNLIETMPIWWGKIDSMTKTLIYNDLQIRNMAMRFNNKENKLCLFDWEVATTHIPQRDLVEFLSYVISEQTTDTALLSYLDVSRCTLEQYSDKTIDRKEWLEGCLLALYDYQLERLSIQLIFHKVVQRTDIERVWHSSRRLLRFLKKELEQTK